MPTSWSTTGTRRLVHTTVAAAVAAVALQAAPASAAPAAPQITGPSGDTGPSVELSWTPVEAAVGYEVRVDNDPAFGSAEWTSATVNTVSVPTKLLGKGQQYMGVRAKDSTGAWSDWTTSAFTVTAAAGPELLGPDEGITLAQPADPPLLTWTPVSGAASYTVEVDTEPGFVSPSTYPTEATALVVPDNHAPDVTYYWRVRADLANGFSTNYSDYRSYAVAPIVQPAILGPGSDQDITDIVLDWSPVAGGEILRAAGRRRRELRLPRGGARQDLRHPVLAEDDLRQRPVLLAGAGPRPRRQPHGMGPCRRRRALRLRPRLARRARSRSTPSTPPAPPGRVRRRPLLRVEPGPPRVALRALAQPRPQLHRADDRAPGQCTVAGTTYTPGSSDPH